MIGVVDYRAGNAPSVLYALARLGVDARLVGSASDVAGVDRVVLPGVGAARATMDSLHAAGLIEPLRRRVHDDGAPFLGICIGLQVLLDHSDEGDTPGLGWIPGVVRRFPPSVRVPQIGWNAVTPTRIHPLLRGLPPDAHCYFVNSYYAAPTEPDDILATTEYAGAFSSVIARGNVAATQFHAEKSGEIGLRILRNFAEWDGTEGSPC